MVKESIMPNYPWLKDNLVDGANLQAHMRGLQVIGVPYTDGDIETAAAEVEGKTDEDAMVAYLQVLGTMVDFSKYDEGYFTEFR